MNSVLTAGLPDGDSSRHVPRRGAGRVDSAGRRVPETWSSRAVRTGGRRPEPSAATGRAATILGHLTAASRRTDTDDTHHPGRRRHRTPRRRRPRRRRRRGRSPWSWPPSACGGASADLDHVGPTPRSIVKPPTSARGLQLRDRRHRAPGHGPGRAAPVHAVGADQAGTAALAHIDATAAPASSSGFTIPGGTELYAGPDNARRHRWPPSPPAIRCSSPSRCCGPRLRSAHWLATFVACGGERLYWIDVTQIGQADQTPGAVVTYALDAAMGDATVHDVRGIPSTLPIMIEGQQFAWKHPGSGTSRSAAASTRTF